MVTFKRAKSRHANKGTDAESVVQKFLEEWSSVGTQREYSRLVDTKAAGRIIKAAKADFEFYCTTKWGPSFGLIEVKETEHEYRLGRDRVSQMPSLMKRNHCGGSCFVLVHHSTLKAWRVLSVAWLEVSGDKGSWNISEFPTFPTPGAALAHLAPDFA